jgi:hypothetical protein
MQNYIHTFVYALMRVRVRRFHYRKHAFVALCSEVKQHLLESCLAPDNVEGPRYKTELRNIISIVTLFFKCHDHQESNLPAYYKNKAGRNQ